LAKSQAGFFNIYFDQSKHKSSVILFIESVGVIQGIRIQQGGVTLKKAGNIEGNKIKLFCKLLKYRYCKSPPSPPSLLKPATARKRVFLFLINWLAFFQQLPSYFSYLTIFCLCENDARRVKKIDYA
jgi:hypothetical protein